MKTAKVNTENSHTIYVHSIKRIKKKLSDDNI